MPPTPPYPPCSLASPGPCRYEPLHLAAARGLTRVRPSPLLPRKKAAVANGASAAARPAHTSPH
jgi:hypothetical protein